MTKVSTIIDESTAMKILGEMHQLRDGKVPLLELGAIRKVILANNVLRESVPNRILEKLASAYDRSSLFHSLFAFWGWHLAQTPLIRDKKGIYAALTSKDTKDVVRGYHAVAVMVA